MGQAMPESDEGGVRDRDSSSIRGGRLRSRVHARAQGARGTLARRDEQEKVVAPVDKKRTFYFTNRLILTRGSYDVCTIPNYDRSKTQPQRMIRIRDVDGFVLPVPKKNLQAYRRMAEK